MDPRLLQYYERELRHVREMGAEFAREFPKVAGRLGLDGTECADPYVERLLEAFGFMAARIQLKIDAEFPRFTQHLLELVCPHYLVPTPSMAVVQLTPNLLEGALAAGFPVPVESVLRSRLAKGEQTPCEYRTKHALQLFPLQVTQAEYTTVLGELRDVHVPGPIRAKAMLRLTLKATAGLSFDQLTLDRLPLFLAGEDEVALRLYELLVSGVLCVVARGGKKQGDLKLVLDAQPGLRALGFDDDCALLPYSARSFHGYRLLHEYFAFPSRFLFVELLGLAQAARQCRDSELQLLILLDREDATLEGIVDAGRLLPFCTPAINLFPREVDRIHLSEREREYHVVADRTRPLDLEIYRVDRVVGHGARAVQEREFLPLYAAGAAVDGDGDKRQAYYTVQRAPRAASSQRRKQGPRSSYVGSEVFLSLVDASDGPFSLDLRQLSVQALCTNRDLPLHMTLGDSSSDFRLQSGAPVEAVRCVAGPSAPRASHAHGDVSWRLISHLTLNYLSLIDTDQRQGAAALRELLALYADLGDPSTRKQVRGVQSVSSASVLRPLPGPGPICFGRGLEVTLECDDAAFQGGGAFLLASVLERFFAKYVAINSFTETVLRTAQRGEIMRWPTTSGQRHLL